MKRIYMCRENIEIISGCHLMKIPKILFLTTLILLLLGLNDPVYSQITVDEISTAVGAKDATTTAVDHETGNGSSCLMIVGISSRERDVYGVTYNGDDLTLLGSRVTNNAYTYIYYLLNPDEGINLLTVNHEKLGGEHRVVVGVMTLFGVDLNNPLGTFNSSSGTASSGNTTIESSEGDMVFAVLAIEKAKDVSNVTSGQTSIWNIDTDAQVGADGPWGAGSRTDALSGTSTTMSWSWTGSKPWSISGVAIKAGDPCNPVYGENLTSAADADVWTYTPDLNFGACNVIYLNSLYQNRIFLQFDLSAIPASAVITGATLRMTKVGGNVESHPISVHQLTNAWDEGSGSCSGASGNVTWNDRMTGTPWTTAGGDFNSTPESTTSVAGEGVYDWDLTSLAQQWVSGNEDNYGVLLKFETEVAINREKIFASREYATPSSRPQLIINYTIPLSGEVTKSDLDCNGGNNGEIIVSSPTGGSGSYAYRLNEGSWQSSGIFSELSAGTYTVWIRDANATECEVGLGDYTITEPEVLSATVTKTDITCNGEDDGTITVSLPLGGYGTYQTSIDNANWFEVTAENPKIFTDLSVAPYTVRLRDAANTDCVVNLGDQTITEPEVLSASVETTDVSCNGEEDGTITVSLPLGGYGTYQTSINNTDWYAVTPEAPYNFTVLGADTYTVQLRDLANTDCVVNLGDQTIIEPPVLSLTANKSNVVCYGQSNGSVTGFASGGTPPYQYKLNDGSYGSNSSFTGLATGTYTIWAKDANNCETSTNVTINEPSQIEVDETIVQPTCFGDGSISLTVTGGTPPYTYDWADLPGSLNPKNRTGLNITEDTDYTVTVTDSKGCTFTPAPYTLLAPEGCEGLTVCQSDDESILTVDPDPDVTSYEWSILDFETPPNYYNSAIINPAGGTGPLPSVIIDWGSVPVGSYKVCVVAHNICGTSEETCIPVNVITVDAEAAADPVCEGGDLFLYASGGDSYSWSGPGGFTSTSANPVIYDATSAMSGDYYVEVTNADGCVATASVTVSVSIPPAVSAANINNAACGQALGSINLSVDPETGSYSYLWNTGATTQDIENLLSGNYSVLVTDLNTGCTTEETFTIIDLPGPVVSAVATPVSCSSGSDGTVTAKITSGGTAPFTYAWSNGVSHTTNDLSHTISGLITGNYSVVVTDVNGCISASSAQVTQPNPLTLDYTRVNVSCFGESTGSINLIVNGGTPGFTYAWTKNGSPFGGDTQDLTAITAGVYMVTVTDNNLCTASATITITQPAAALAAIATPTHVGCNDGSDGQIILSVSGGTPPYHYVWSNSATSKDITGLVAGTYSVTITDAKGCTYESEDIQVTEPDELVASGVTTDISCFEGADGAITLTIEGGTSPFAYSWSNGATTKDLSGVTAGDYDVTVVDDNGCTATAIFTLTEPSLLDVSVTLKVDVSCYGGSDGSIDITVEGGTEPYTFSWSNGSVLEDLMGLPAGLYTILVTDAKGCTAQTSATVNQPPLMSVSGSVTNNVCFGGASGAIEITVTGGTAAYSYSWTTDIGTGLEPAEKNQSGLTIGTYTVTVTDAENCVAVAGFTITQPGQIQLSMLNSDVSCFGGSDGSINLTVTGGVTPYTYSWEGPNGFTAGAEDITDLSVGTYTVTVTDFNGCEAVLTSDPVQEPTQLSVTVDLIKDVTCRGGDDGEAQANPVGGTPPYSYLWSEGTVSSFLTASAGTYQVEVTDAKGCTAISSIQINEPEEEIELYAIIRNTSWCEGNTGEIELIVENGVEPFTYSWTGPGSYTADTKDISGLAAGTYTVIVEDALGCTATLGGIEVETAPDMEGMVTVINRTCLVADGEAYAIVSGGVEPYTYLWEPGGQTTSFIAGLDVGTYTVTVTDADGCEATYTGTVGIPECNPPVAEPYYYETCGTFTNSVALHDAHPDFENSDLVFLPVTFPSTEEGSIEWGSEIGGELVFNGTFTYTPAAEYTGIFSVVYFIEDPNGLTATSTLTISVSQMSAQFSEMNIAHESCGASDGSATVTLSGGFAPYTYVWSHNPDLNDPTAAGLAAGTYSVTVTDSQGCSVSAEVTILNVCLTIEKQLAAVNGDNLASEYNDIGDILEYEIIVTNTSNAILFNVLVTDPLTNLEQTIVSLLPGAPNAESITTYYTVTEEDLLSGQVDNIATASFTFNDEEFIRQDDETVFAGIADIRVEKFVETTPVNAGGELIYRIVVTNDGPALARNITITDIITAFPNPLYALTLDGTFETWPGNYQLENSLVKNQSFTLYIKGVVSINQCSPVSNTVTVNAENDESPGNNTFTVITDVEDHENPVISICPPDFTGDDFIEGCTTDAILGFSFSETLVVLSDINDFPGTAEDNCGIVTVTYIDVTSGLCPIIVSRTWTVKDPSGNSSSCVQMFEIIDTEKPLITTTATNQYFGCNPTITAPVFTGSDNCEGTITPTVTTDGVTNTGCSFSQTWRANYTDVCGNQADEVSITYNWTVATQIEVDCSQPIALNSCTSLVDIQAAYLTWIDGFTFTGGCDVTDNKADIPVLPINVECSGANLEFNFIASDACSSDICSSTFTVDATPGLIITEATDKTVISCAFANQTAVDADFSDWLATAGVSGGCSPTSTPDITTAPDYCGGSVVVTWTIADQCYAGSTYSAAYTVTAPSDVLVTEATDKTVNACEFTDQTAVDADFADWLLTAGVSGGCSPTSTPDITTAPDYCGGSLVVTWTIADRCYATSTYSATYTVTAPSAVVVTEATDKTVNSCEFTDQTAVQADFDAWLLTAGVSGGCSPTSTPDITTAPDYCGGSVVVTWTIADHCYTPSTYSATYTVTATAALIVTEAQNKTVDACDFADQTEVQADFVAWLLTAGVSGGCSPTSTPDITPAPDYCGGSVVVTWTIADHCYATSTYSATYTVTAPSALTVTEAQDKTVDACDFADQTEVQADFDAWLLTAGVSGGCTPTSTPDITTAPDYCGGSVVVTWTIADQCYPGSTYSATYTINPPPGVVIAEVEDLIIPPCSFTSQEAADQAFASWLGGFSVSGGCTPTFGTNPGIPTAPNYQGGAVEVTWTVNDHCFETSIHTATFTITPLVEIEAYVYLEGSAIKPDGQSIYTLPMRTTLNFLKVLPGQMYSDFFYGTYYSPPGQPYNIPPWSYNGNEGEYYDSGGDPLNGDANYPATVVDWVLVSLRDNPAGTGGPVCQAAALLHKDGTIEFVGGGPACCDVNMNTSYWVVVEHRNHLIVMSHESVAIVDGKIIYDFRIQQSYLNDPFGFGFYARQKEILSGKYAMYGGNGGQVVNAQSDTDITFDDRSFWEEANGIFGRYSNSDYNMNGDNNFNDRVMWEFNNGKFTSVPRN
ncbi:MAG: DNRLRE domain-containing protein [Bacteroidales bacterium]|nr:DNRLRE domain-containing protein [Bacteroidales bacterium]